MATATLEPSILESLPEFLAMISAGVGSKNAAVASGWTLRQLKELESRADFQEAMSAAREQLIESVEEKAAKMALAGNVPMIQMILYCHGADRGWRPPTQRVNVNHQGSPAAERVMAVTAAALELMATHGHKALALGGPLDEAIEATVADQS